MLNGQSPVLNIMEDTTFIHDQMLQSRGDFPLKVGEQCLGVGAVKVRDRIRTKDLQTQTLIALCCFPCLRRLVHGVRESLPWKREEIDGERDR